MLYIAMKTVRYDAGDHFLVQNHEKLDSKSQS